MKMQPLQQGGGVNFAFKSAVGQGYQIDFYVNLGTTDNTDQLQFDYPSSTANGLGTTGHYTFNFTATDTLSNFEPYYNATGGTPHHFFLFDSLKIVATGTTLDTIKSYNSQIVSISDYYPFGSPIKGRTWSSSNYRYGFNGKEKDDEIDGEGNSYDFGSRIYDPRLSRYLSIDPAYRKHADVSPYAYSMNNPIMFIDIMGEDIVYFNTKGDEIPEKRVVDEKVNKTYVQVQVPYESPQSFLPDQTPYPARVAFDFVPAEMPGVVEGFSEEKYQKLDYQIAASTFLFNKALDEKSSDVPYTKGHQATSETENPKIDVNVVKAMVMQESKAGTDKGPNGTGVTDPMLNVKRIPLEQVQLFVGHKWISTTARFLQAPMDEQRLLINKLHPLG
jgi:RHS repeat-associated protein